MSNLFPKYLQYQLIGSEFYSCLYGHDVIIPIRWKGAIHKSPTLPYSLACLLKWTPFRGRKVDIPYWIFPHIQRGLTIGIQITYQGSSNSKLNLGANLPFRPVQS